MIKNLILVLIVMILFAFIILASTIMFVKTKDIVYLNIMIISTIIISACGVYVWTTWKKIREGFA